MSKSSTALNPIQLAVVSPCSACQNQTTVAKDGRPVCPRRQYQKKVEDGVAEVSEHLTLTGSEGDDLKNPVYWDDGKATLIWVATLADNPGIRKSDGTLLTPHLLDPEFKTEYIQCRPLPVVPASYEALYFTGGAFNEGDQLIVQFTANQQLESDKSGLVMIDGFAQKVHFAFHIPRIPLDKDLVPAGT